MKTGGENQIFHLEIEAWSWHRGCHQAPGEVTHGSELDFAQLLVATYRPWNFKEATGVPLTELSVTRDQQPVTALLSEHTLEFKNLGVAHVKMGRIDFRASFRILRIHIFLQ